MSKTFEVDVDGIGRFLFHHRTVARDIRIGGEVRKLGVPEPEDGEKDYLGFVAIAYATLTVLTAESPDGWDLQAMDPLDDSTYAKIMEVHAALKAAENRFRGIDPKAGKAESAGNAADGGVLVSQEVQPTAD